MNNNSIKKIVYILLLIVFTSTIYIISKRDKVKEEKPLTVEGFYFDTYITVSIYDSCDESISDKILNLCKEYDNLLSPENNQSEIYKFNNSVKNKFTFSKETYTLLNEALQFSYETNGKIDPTIYSCYKLYNFNCEENSLPDKNLIDKELKKVNYKSLKLNYDFSITKDDNQEINLGYIAKGYIADRISDLLKENNVENAIINLGGNILCIGHPYGKEKYNIGIQSPFDTEKIIYKIGITNKSIVTSGKYERYFTQNGKRYSHIIDTQTGLPIDNNIESVTVIGPKSSTCDGLSTTLSVLDVNDGLNYIKTSYPDYCCLYVINNGNNNYEIIKSDNFTY